MKQISLFMGLVVLVPSLSYGADSQIEELIRQKQGKIERLEKCQGATKGLKIAGISTLGLTAVGVGANIAEATKIKANETTITQNESKITSMNKEIAEARCQAELMSKDKLVVETKFENDKCIATKCKANAKLKDNNSGCQCEDGYKPDDKNEKCVQDAPKERKDMSTKIITISHDEGCTSLKESDKLIVDVIKEDSDCVVTKCKEHAEIQTDKKGCECEKPDYVIDTKGESCIAKAPMVIDLKDVDVSEGLADTPEKTSMFYSNPEYMRWKPLVDDGYTMTKNNMSENNADLKNGQWAVTFSYGTVKGEAMCSAQGGTQYASKSDTKTLKEVAGRKDYCWCRPIEFIPSQENAVGKVSNKKWLLGSHQKPSYQVQTCINVCAYFCANIVAVFSSFRNPLYH